MFPEIVRDEVFRLETRRLWLRWPTMADAFDAAGATSAKALGWDAAGAGMQVPAKAMIAAWRAANECGEGLHLVLEDKRTRTALGTIHLALASQRHGTLVGHLSPCRRGGGLMTEAVQAVVHMAFLLDAVTEVVAAPLAADDDCGQGVLEQCGFTPDGTEVAASTGPAARDRFTLDRRTWAGLRRWVMPASGTVAQRAAPERPCVPLGA